MRLKGPQPMQEATFDLTPMIDIVLLLIIFFMLTSHFAKTQRTEVDLPRERGEPVKSEERPTSIVIDMDKAGKMKVLGVSMTAQGVAEMVGAQTGRGPRGVDVVVRADRQCASEHLNTLSNLLMGLGVREWKLATAGPEGAAMRGGGG